MEEVEEAAHRAAAAQGARAANGNGADGADGDGGGVHNDARPLRFYDGYLEKYMKRPTRLRR